MSMDDRAFLGVERSALGQRWMPRLDPRGEAMALAIIQSHQVSDLMARVLAARGVSVDSVPTYLEPRIRDLMPDPQSLTDMAKASDRLAKAAMVGQRIAIFGDYDVDGAASSALVARFMRHFGCDVEIYIPDRIFEGYGPNPTAMADLARRADLIVTVDCGTNSAEAIAAATRLGVDVMVIDHHQVGGALPVCTAVVNPNREDDLSGLGHLCAAGVVFMVLVATASILRREKHLPPDLVAMLDLVALATIADVVPLQGLNRAFVTAGLRVARAGTNPGMAALTLAARVSEPLKPFHFGFLLGPRINAGGRVGDAALGARLLATDDAEQAKSIAEQLDVLNAERQAIEKQVLAQAEAEMDAEMVVGDGPAVVVTANRNWHPGVVGIVAARLKEKAHRPVFAIAVDANGKCTGSGRSISGFDLGRAVRKALGKGIIEKGGGHAMAAGVTLKESRLGEFRAFFEFEYAREIAALRDARALKIDAAISADGADVALIDDVERAGPFGQGNPQPVLALPDHRIASIRTVGQDHIKVTLQSRAGGKIEAMAFRAADTPLGDLLQAHAGRHLHIAGTLSRNHWQGRESAEIRIVDAAVAR